MTPSSLSPHLFRDVRVGEVDPQRHAPWPVRRVLECGDWPDLQSLVHHYGKDRLSGIVTSLRILDPKALAFCEVWFDLPRSALRCSMNPQSPP